MEKCERKKGTKNRIFDKVQPRTRIGEEKERRKMKNNPFTRSLLSIIVARASMKQKKTR